MEPASARAAEAERWSSLCNCVVNFLLQERYHLTAFELLHELIEDGRHDHAIRLKSFFSDPNMFPQDQISRFNSLRVADPQTLLEEKLEAEEKLAISEYELRLAQEDVSRLKEELQKLAESFHAASEAQVDGSGTFIPANQFDKREKSVIDLGPLKDSEKKDLNCAVKEYLLFAGYRLTAMTFYEEVTDQNLDSWPKSPACISDALRHYYYQFLSSTDDAAEEKIKLVKENESLVKEKERLITEKGSLLKSKELADSQIVVLAKSLEAAQRELKEKDILVQDLKKSLEFQRKELNDCRAEITSLKMHIEGSSSSKGLIVGEHEQKQALYGNNDLKGIKGSNVDLDELRGMRSDTSSALKNNTSGDNEPQKKDIHMHEDKGIPASFGSVSDISFVGNNGHQIEENIPKLNSISLDSSSSNCNAIEEHKKLVNKPIEDGTVEYTELGLKQHIPQRGTVPDKVVLETIQILSDALPKIVPYVLINHREELLPLIMCAIERHPDGNVRDSLTHTLFNLIKRPDEQQRRIIMDACVNLAKNVGEMRTETELLPQCWEQINHTYEERRLLVAQSCGELAQFVRPEICDSLILSIVQQLIEDSATVVREAAAHNLAILLPLFPNLDKYFKVEELMFQLACDPSRVVVDTTLKELLPAVIKWGGKLDHVLRVLLTHLLGSAQRCPPLSGVEGSLESHLRVLGEGERWNIDVLLRMLTELLPDIHEKAIETCPFAHIDGSNTSSELTDSVFSTNLLRLYAGEHVDWVAFDWLHVDCFHDLIQLACFLPQKEDNLRSRMSKFLLNISNHFGDDYVTHIMLPVFLIAVGDSADLTFFPSSIQSQIKGLRPKTPIAERLAILCVLPLLLCGILGSPSRKEQLSGYLRKLLVHSTDKEGLWPQDHANELIDAVRFLCTFEEHHGIIFNILWEMVVSSHVDMKITATSLLKVLVPYVDVKVASTHVVPALITLGSDQNLNVKYASIDAFGAVAQHFKNETIVDKIRVQMDAFLEDGSHEATVAVVRALVVAVPHTIGRLREYLLSKIFQLTATPPQTDVARRRERTNAFCEAIRALDATDIPATSVRDFLLPSIQNLLKDLDSLDPAHKEALEVILKERSGGTLETISKVMGAHLGIASSVTSFFGDSGLLAKRDGGGEPTDVPVASPQPSPPAQADDTRYWRIMKGNFGDMLRVRGKGHEDSPNS